MSQLKVHDVHQAQSQLPQLIDAVLRGERVVVRRETDGVEIELIRHVRKREAGRYKGRITYAPDVFDAI